MTSTDTQTAKRGDIILIQTGTEGATSRAKVLRVEPNVYGQGGTGYHVRFSDGAEVIIGDRFEVVATAPRRGCFPDIWDDDNAAIMADDEILGMDAIMVCRCGERHEFKVVR